MAVFAVGDRVVRNPVTWQPNDFDTWGRGVGVGVVVEPPFPLGPDEVDVRWPGGRCFEWVAQLLPAPLEADAERLSSAAVNNLGITPTISIPPLQRFVMPRRDRLD